MSAMRWQPLFGEFSITSDTVTFLGRQEPFAAEDEVAPAAGLIVCSSDFAGGEIRLSAEFPENSATSVEVVVAYDPETRAKLVAGLRTSPSDEVDPVQQSQYVVRLVAGNRKEDKTYGETDWVPSADRKSVSLEVKRVGSVVDVYDGGVCVLRARVPNATPMLQVGVLVSSLQTVRVREFSVRGQKRSAFVVMQFAEQFNHLYNEVIKPVAQGCGYEVVRADDVAGPGLIISDINRQIKQCDVIIADITPENANVFYEVGYAHALGKPTILLAEKGRKLPFDVSGFRTLFYDNSIAGKSDVERNLKRHLQAVAVDESSLKPVGVA